MRRDVLLAVVVVCCLAAPASATVTVIAGNHVLLPNTPGQVVQVVISSDVPQGIQSADLGLGIIDLGPPNDGIPPITAVDMTSPGTVFGDAPAGNTGQVDFEAFPTENQLSSIASISGDTFPAVGGVLANVTIDTSGIFGPEVFTFDLTYAPFFLPTSTSSIPAQNTVLVIGTISIAPCEPSSIIMGTLAGGGLGFVAVRRRWQQRRRR